MTIQHHPSDSLLTAFAAGTLDQGQHVAIATHLVACPHCRSWMHSMEHLGGAILGTLPPTAMSSGALARIEARRRDPIETAKATPGLAPSAIDDLPGLPKFMRQYPTGRWTWIAPQVHLRRVELPEASRTRVFLLKSGAGTKMLQHSHTGLEMTCVLAGAFTHESGRYGPGDFDLGDETVDHQPIVEFGGRLHLPCRDAGRPAVERFRRPSDAAIRALVNEKGRSRRLAGAAQVAAEAVTQGRGGARA